MKLGVLHLSDIHFRDENDPARNYAESIASACFQTAHQSDSFIVVVTGDIAFGGKENEYTYAQKLFSKIKWKLEEETGKNVYFFLTPGNHDCSLVPEDEIRTLTVERVISAAAAGTEVRDAWVTQCASAQKEYFDFESKFREIEPVFEDKLWKEYEIAVGGSLLRISALNAAWMSTIHEKAGQLVFPIENYRDQLENPCSLRLALIHHPLNWYCQSTYHPMRRALKTHCNAILSGHEHVIGSEVVNDISGSTLMLEAPALQPHEKNYDPQFNCLLFDTDEKTVQETRFKATERVPEQIGSQVTHSFDATSKSGIQNRVHADFHKVLMDPGGNFTHPHRGELTAEDMFVYPQLEESSAEVSKKTLYADTLICDWEIGKRVLLLGDDEGGKTFLLRRYFSDIHEQGGLPLYLKSDDIKSVTERDIDKMLDSVAKLQYANQADFKYAERRKKVVLLDDFDSVKGDLKVRERLIEILEDRFVSVVLTGGSRFKLSELVGAENAKRLASYTCYKIKPFGHLLRNSLIKKWCMLGEVQTLVELDAKIHSAETLINGILSKSIVPAKPVYLLIFLQSNEQNEQGELQNSSFSYYYQYLITKSLKEAGHRPDELDEMFSYLSQLAWYFKVHGRKELSARELREFNNKFSEEYTSVDFDDRIRLLYRSKILAKSGEYYRFTYAYIYYLFVGKHLSDNLHEEAIMRNVEECCEKLYLRENANTIMFLTHYSSDPRVIRKISSTLDSCFAEADPLHLNGDTESINSLVESATRLVIKNPDVCANQLNNRSFQDQLESQSEEHADEQTDELEEKQDSALSISSDINLTMKTSEILANIVKNYYGSIKKADKKSYIHSIFDSSLRTLSTLFCNILDQPDSFVAELEKSLAERFPKMSNEERESHAKQFAFQLIGLITTSFIARTGSLVSSDKLREDVAKSVAEKEGNSYRLIEVASCLTQPGKIPFDILETLAKDLKQNTFAFTVLQTLVHYHLHMFHTTDRDKQRLSDIARISIQQSRAIDYSSRKSKAAETSGI